MVPYFHWIHLHWVGCHPWSTMPPWYALPVLHVGFSSICWHLFWSNWGHKFHSRYPQSITLHPARLTSQPRISIASTGLKYQNLMEYDCMRDSSKRWKNNDFPHIPYYHIPGHFTSDEKKNKNNLFRFIKKKLAVCDGFSGILCLLWSTKICEYMWSAMGSSGVQWHHTPRVRCHMSMRGGKSPERRILGHNSPNSTTERMLVVVV